MKNLILKIPIVFFGMLITIFVSSCIQPVDKDAVNKQKKTYDVPKANADSLTVKKEKETKVIKNNNGIVGVWSSYSAREYGFVKITIKKLGNSSNKFKSTADLIDGSIHTESLTQGSNGKFLTKNKFGEYYKLVGDNLDCYDREGFLFSLDRGK